MKKLYYHATPWDNYEKIMSEGIKLGTDHVVYLCDSIDNAIKFVAIRGVRKIAIFEVELDDKEVEESFDHSEAFFKCKAWTIGRAIKQAELLNLYVSE